MYPKDRLVCPKIRISLIQSCDLGMGLRPSILFYGRAITILVGGFNPIEKYKSKWITSQNWDENKKYSKPPPRISVDSIETGLGEYMSRLRQHIISNTLISQIEKAIQRLLKSKMSGKITTLRPKDGQGWYYLGNSNLFTLHRN